MHVCIFGKAAFVSNNVNRVKLVPKSIAIKKNLASQAYAKPISSKYPVGNWLLVKRQSAIIPFMTVSNYLAVFHSCGVPHYGNA